MGQRKRLEQGNIYVEVVIAAAVVAVGLLPVFGGWAVSERARQTAGLTNQALAIARGYIERYHAIDSQAWAGVPASRSTPDSGFQVLQEAADRTDPPGIKDVKVTVSWTDAGGAHAVTLATSVARR